MKLFKAATLTRKKIIKFTLVYQIQGLQLQQVILLVYWFATAKTKSQVCSKYQRRWHFDLSLLSLLPEVWLLSMIKQRDLKEVKELKEVWVICISTFVFVSDLSLLTLTLNIWEFLYPVSLFRLCVCLINKSKLKKKHTLSLVH